jgi:WG repeat protein
MIIRVVFLFVTVLCFGNETGIGLAQSRILFPVNVAGKAGFIDHAGKLAIEPQFDEARDFAEGLAAVRINITWGYIDAAGKVVIPLQFATAADFSEGFALVSNERGQRGLIDHNGVFSTMTLHGWVYGFSEGLARVGIGERRGVGSFQSQMTVLEQWLFFNHDGTTVLRPQFDYVDDFHEGLARVGRRTKDRFLINYIHKDGRLAFVDWFMAGHSFSEGVAIVSHDPNGVTHNNYGRLDYDNFNDDAPNSFTSNKPIDFLIIDRTGNKISAGTFEDISDFSEGVVAFKIHGKWGYLNKQGQIVIKPQFDSAHDFSEGLAAVREKNKNYYINLSGERVLSISCDSADDFHHGLARMRISGKTAYIDKTGRTVWTPSK